MLRRLSIYLCLLLAISPSLIWISLDRRVWPWDQAWYGQVSVELFHTLIHSPQQWIADMLAAFGTKAPGIAWIGQFFIPLGALVGSIDAGLLLSILITQFLTLFLIFKSVVALTQGRLPIALVASLTIASAPLFVAMSHQYLVEPLQTLAVAWFILTMSFAPQWSRKLILSHLLGAVSLAMIAKVTSPLYCLGPGSICLAYVCYPSPTKEQDNPPKPFEIGHYLILGFAVILLSGTIAWYIKNLIQIVHFAAASSSGTVSELYGKKDTFINKLAYWLSSTQKSFFFPSVLIILNVTGLGGLMYYLLRKRTKLNHFSVCACAALFHVLLTLVVFSTNINEENRYLLPLLPHIAILVAWSLTQFNHQLLTSFVCLTLITQLLAVHAQALGMTSLNQSISHWLYSIDRDPNPALDLKQVVEKTCNRSTDSRYNIIGVEEPWLNANSASYFSAKLREPQRIRCYYTSLGYAESNSSKAWKRLLDLKIVYFITLESDRQPKEADAFNQVSQSVLEKAKTSKTFELESLISRSGILLYRNRQATP